MLSLSAETVYTVQIAAATRPEPHVRLGQSTLLHITGRLREFWWFKTFLRHSSPGMCYEISPNLIPPVYKTTCNI
jgi:hypothetical protein